MTNSKKAPSVAVWTDGSCLINPGGPGGWAALIVYNDGRREQLVGGHPDTTNNRMELLGAITALEQLAPSFVCVTSDSEYVVRGASSWMINWKKRGWKLKNGDPIKNPDLWQRLDAAVGRHHKVEWKWVRGHSGNENNELVDSLAEAEARKYPHDPVKVRERAELIERARAGKRRESPDQRKIREMEDELTPGIFKRWL